MPKILPTVLEKFYKNIDFYDRCSEQSRIVLCEKYDPDVVKVPITTNFNQL